MPQSFSDESSTVTVKMVVVCAGLLAVALRVTPLAGEALLEGEALRVTRVTLRVMLPAREEARLVAPRTMVVVCVVPLAMAPGAAPKMEALLEVAIRVVRVTTLAAPATLPARIVEATQVAPQTVALLTVAPLAQGDSFSFSLSLVPQN